jgi:hypothetical protein
MQWIFDFETDYSLFFNQKTTTPQFTPKIELATLYTYDLQFVSKSKIHQHCILPRKYNRQRRQLLFLVCLEVSEKSGVMK